MGKDANFHNDLILKSIGWALVVFVIYQSLTVTPVEVDITFGDKISHVLAYCILMGWFSQLYTSKQRQIVCALVLCLMGISLEFIQGWGGHRFFEYADMVANTAGVFLGWWLSRGWCAGWLLRIDQMLSRQ
jgi:VanZ family protein